MNAFILEVNNIIQENSQIFVRFLGKQFHVNKPIYHAERMYGEGIRPLIPVSFVRLEVCLIPVHNPLLYKQISRIRRKRKEEKDVIAIKPFYGK